jgi:hypothetical protein
MQQAVNAQISGGSYFFIEPAGIHTKVEKTQTAAQCVLVTGERRAGHVPTATCAKQVGEVSGRVQS